MLLKSRRLYNEQYGNIELDSVYADLLNDYLNYFLPINERDVAFPSFVDASQTKQAMTASPIPTHRQHTSLLKRVIQKSFTEDNLSMLSEPDRAGDMNKIDTFLILIIEILINSFTDPAGSVIDVDLKPAPLDYSPFISVNKIGASAKSVSLTNSPVKLKDPKQYLANTEIVFALSMILKHFHLFSNAFPLNCQHVQNQEWNQLNESLSFTNYRKPVKTIYNTNESPVDELRM